MKMDHLVEKVQEQKVVKVIMVEDKEELNLIIQDNYNLINLVKKDNNNNNNKEEV